MEAPLISPDRLILAGRPVAGMIGVRSARSQGDGRIGSTYGIETE